MNDIEQVYSFSLPNSFKLVANHGEKIFYLLVIIGILSSYQELSGKFLVDVGILVGVLFLILIFIGKFISKVIWRIDIDFSKKKVCLNLCRKSSPVRAEFKEIQQIKVSGPIVFFIGNKKYYYSTNRYEEILKKLIKVKEITWGKMSDILGPDRSIREIIDKEQRNENNV